MNASRKFPKTRLRRTRFSPERRSLIEENKLTTDDLIQPIFVKEDLDGIEKIDSLPGINRIGMNALDEEIEKLKNNNIKAIAIFPVISADKKDDLGSESINENNLVCEAIRQIKRYADMAVIADVALDPYTSHGHDGVLDETGYVDNDESLEVLIKQAMVLARAGADMIAPSDMMDGRISGIREALEKEKFVNTIILSYAAKYSSKFYGPFRDAVGSSMNIGKGSKDTYQMSVANSDEALHEVRMDLEEGADIVMVKPGMPFLDIIKSVKETFKVPTFAYQVSGEYAMLKAAIENNWLEESVLFESLLSFKRAGADAILTYAANEIASKLNK